MRRVALLALLLLLAAGAVAAAAPSGSDPLPPAPAYHRPFSWWRARHPELVRLEPLRRGLPDGRFQAAECLICHRAGEFCNRCHARLGAALVPEARP